MFIELPFLNKKKIELSKEIKNYFIDNNHINYILITFIF